MLNGYAEACHRVQTAIAVLMGRDPHYAPVQIKHLRVGVDMSKSDQGGMAMLLIAKGVFTEAEYVEAITNAAMREAENYEREVQAALGNPGIRLV